jgi:hypothetical protein
MQALRRPVAGRAPRLAEREGGATEPLDASWRRRFRGLEVLAQEETRRHGSSSKRVHGDRDPRAGRTRRSR